MSNNPLQPDPSKPSPSAAPANAALRAVLAGVSIEICVSTLLEFVLRTVYVAQVSMPDMTPAQVDDALRNMPTQSPLVSLGILLGALISVAAGYVCARIARRNEYAVGAIMAVATTLIFLAIDDTGSEPLDLALLFIVSDVACNMLGVKYGRAQNRRLERQAGIAVDKPAP
jgi:MFS-type transporter involved in bile tolerance (Atg22 family)